MDVDQNTFSKVGDSTPDIMGHITISSKDSSIYYFSINDYIIFDCESISIRTFIWCVGCWFIIIIKLI